MRPATRLRLATCPSRRLVPFQRHFINTTTLPRTQYEGPAGFDISSKVFPVTGATGGLGLAASIYLAKQGAHVYCLDRSDEPPKQWLEAQEAVAELGKGELSYMKLDVKDHDAQHEVMAKIADKHQGIDGGYFAAGINCTSDLLDYAPEQAKEVMDINFMGVLWSLKACATQMIKYNKKGCLVPVASMSAKVANRNLHCAPYNASKAAVVSLCQTAAAELAVHGIRVNAINPGNCLTPMVRQNFRDKPELEQEWKNANMLGRISDPEEYNGAVLYLLSGASTFMTGSAITVDGGYTAW